MGPTFGSLFAGIGGLDLGLTLAGWQCSWQSETDRACNWVLGEHWPDVRRYGDIREIRTEQLEAVDLVCGGFPCQDVSVAGKRKGLAGERSGLWFEFHRLLAELAPKWVVVENVPGLLSSNGGRDFAVILQGLVEIGYGVCWRILDAQYFGVAQRRRRVFIVGSLGDGCAAEVLFECKSSAWDSPPSRQEGTQVADPITKSFAKHHGRSAGKDSYPRNIVMHALSGHNQRNDPDGEHFIVDEVSRPLAFGQTMNHYDAGHRTYIMQASQVPAVSVTENIRAEVRLTPAVESLSGGGGKMGQGYAAALTQLGVRRLTPTECERLQGFPDGWTEGQADSTRYRQLGNAVTVNVAEWIGKRIAKAHLGGKNKRS